MFVLVSNELLEHYCCAQERHLQEVILAQQTNCHREVFIPTPEVAVDVTHYERVYQKILYRQTPYIRVPGKCVPVFHCMIYGD